MPNYKKRKHNRILSSPGRPKKTRTPRKEADENIKMTPSGGRKKTVAPQSNMKVVKGKKLEQKRRLKALSIAAAVIIVVVTVFQLVLPAGIIETASNTLSLLGSGSYPIEFESTDTLNAVSVGSYYYVLTNSYVNAFTSSGKELFSHAHGFENPIIKVSSSRAIVFNQGGNSALIFNNSGLKETVTTEKDIITAGISDSGVYALATHSDKYAAAVSVYSKSNKELYEWYSAEETVNNVIISPNGKKIAVSTFNASVGQYKSTLNVLNFKSATPEHTESFDGTLIYNLDSSSRNGFSVITANKVKYIKWSKYKSQEYSNDYNIAFFKASKGGKVAVFNRESDKTDNRIAVFSKSGELKTEFQYKGIISDIQLFGNHIYCMSETDIYLLSSEGKVLRSASCGFGGVRLVVTGTNNVAVITDNEIEKIKLEQENEK